MNGSFKIRPNPEQHAFAVECEFNENQGTTILKPNQWKPEGFTFPPTEDERCSGANCFTHNFEYSASNDQIKERFKIELLHQTFILAFQIKYSISIKALADISTNCSQSIDHTCTVNPLTKYSSWISRDGVVNS